MTALDTKRLSSTDSPYPDCSLFLNWNEGILRSDSKTAAVFQSLVATVKLQPALDDSLEAKAVKFLKYMHPHNLRSTTDFLNNFASNSDESLKIFIQSIVILVSSPNQIITTAAMRMLVILYSNCYAKVRLALVKANLISQLIITLNPQSLSFAESVDIHISLLHILNQSVTLTTPIGLKILTIVGRDEQQAVNETNTEPGSHSPVCISPIFDEQLKNGPIHSQLVV
ncbi:hypothetical protein BLNAU_6929 [Blattamonas nauphoetae]|uniref:Uncharacterized protein n=1 Tax=Blattamonas nauphoetae TaxID=2049346 RepID=A0ABQ9Y2N7_9EUKA|nr:hypothetical protein BLNAU_6929 [Blattamonas nauphoetae]